MEKIKTVQLVRRIRDAQYEMTRKKTREELKQFFHQEAEAANAEAAKLLKVDNLGGKFP